VPVAVVRLRLKIVRAVMMMQEAILGLLPGAKNAAKTPKNKAFTQKAGAVGRR
jgi:hypothetical protein